MRFLAIDLGSARIGLAVSDTEGSIATALCTLPRQGGDRDVQALAKAAREAGAQAVVLGLPLLLSGEEGPASQQVRRLGDALVARLGCRVYYWDERFTTAEAERVLIGADVSRKRRKDVVDQLAAVLILQAFLDHRRGFGAREGGSEDAPGGEG